MVNNKMKTYKEIKKEFQEAINICKKIDPLDCTMCRLKTKIHNSEAYCLLPKCYYWRLLSTPLPPKYWNENNIEEAIKQYLINLVIK